MIIDLQRFVTAERPYWNELEALLDRLEHDPAMRLDLALVQRFHYLYERASADLGRLMTFAYQPEIRGYLEALVARAYGEIHAARRGVKLRPVRWFRISFPCAFRRHIRAFWLAAAATLVGCLFGGLVTAVDPDAKAVLLPFPHLLEDPSRRVEREEQGRDEPGRHATFSTYLMTHNIRISILTVALGMTFGLGCLGILFYNGAILGAVAVDYVLAGETAFLLGWLLPHGSIEIPAIVVAGQAGLVLGGAILGRRQSFPLAERVRRVGRDLVMLMFGVAVLLVWAGLVESFLSQFHEPALPYWVKYTFGAAELFLLASFLWRSGRAEGESALDG